MTVNGLKLAIALLPILLAAGCETSPDPDSFPVSNEAPHRAIPLSHGCPPGDAFHMAADQRANATTKESQEFWRDVQDVHARQAIADCREKLKPSPVK